MRVFARFHDKLENLMNFSLYQLAEQAVGRVRRARSLERFDDSHPCVFVLSTGRVGTLTLAALLRAAPGMMALHEPSPRLYELSCLAYRASPSPETALILSAAFKSIRNDTLDLALKLRRGYVETSPQVTFLAPYILDAVPEAKFIHLARPPWR